MIAFWTAVFGTNVIVWFYATFSPQTVSIAKNYLGLTLSESPFWPPLLFLPLLYFLNLGYAYAFKLAPKLGFSVLFVGLAMIVANALIFTVAEMVMLKKISAGDMFLVVMILIGFGGRYYFLSR